MSIHEHHYLLSLPEALHFLVRKLYTIGRIIKGTRVIKSAIFLFPSSIDSLAYFFQRHRGQAVAGLEHLGPESRPERVDTHL